MTPEPDQQELTPFERILILFDAGHTPRAICSVGISKDMVYAVLRQERPFRTRAPRTRTSLVPGQIVALRVAGMLPVRIADLLGCSKAYVYRTLAHPPAAEPAPE